MRTFLLTIEFKSPFHDVEDQMPTEEFETLIGKAVESLGTDGVIQEWKFSTKDKPGRPNRSYGVLIAHLEEDNEGTLHTLAELRNFVDLKKATLDRCLKVMVEEGALKKFNEGGHVMYRQEFGLNRPYMEWNAASQQKDEEDD